MIRRFLNFLKRWLKPGIRSLDRLVGCDGEFTTAMGDVCQCRVTGTDEPPWDDEILVIDYVTAKGLRVTGAMIPAADFRQSAPNESNSPTPSQQPEQRKETP